MISAIIDHLQAWVNPSGGTMGRSITVKDDEIFRSVVVPWVRQQFGFRA